MKKKISPELFLGTMRPRVRVSPLRPQRTLLRKQKRSLYKRETRTKYGREGEANSAVRGSPRARERLCREACDFAEQKRGVSPLRPQNRFCESRGDFCIKARLEPVALMIVQTLTRSRFFDFALTRFAQNDIRKASLFYLCHAEACRSI